MNLGARLRRSSIVLLAVALLLARLALGYHHHDEEHAAGGEEDDCAICWIAAKSFGPSIEQSVEPLRLAILPGVQCRARARIRGLSWPLPPSRGPPPTG